MSKNRRGVVLDRDGTLIDFVRDAELGVVTTAFHPDQIRFLPGVIEGLTILSQAGFSLAIATNQPGAAKGQIPLFAIVRTNAALVSKLADHGIAIDAIEVCLHHPEGAPDGDASLQSTCKCRKPKPGMLVAIIDRLSLDRASSWMIGDSADDLAAARAAKMRAAILRDTGRCGLCPMRGDPAASSTQPDLMAARFDEIARSIANGSC